MAANAQPGGFSGHERRRSRRHEKSLSIRLLDPMENVIDAQPNVRDVSMHGLCVESTARLAQGEKFRFELVVPGRGPVNGTARVRWLLQPAYGDTRRIGAEFLDMGWGHAGALRGFLEPDYGAVGNALDQLLAVACVVVGMLVFRDLSGGNSRFFAELLDRALESLPQVLVIGGAVLGIVLCFRR